MHSTAIHGTSIRPLGHADAMRLAGGGGPPPPRADHHRRRARGEGRLATHIDF